MYTVSIWKSEKPKSLLKKSIELIGGLSTPFPEKDKKILIKPNFGCSKNAMTGATTDLRIVSYLIELLQSDGYRNILVGDGTMYGFSKINVFKHLGVRKLCAKYGVPLIDLNEDAFVIKKLPNGNSFQLAKTALECEILNLAKLKTHNLVGVSLGVKNLLGCVVGPDKPKVHILGLSKNLVALAEQLKPSLTIIEGLVGMEGDGPVAGSPIRMDTLVTSTNVLAADMIASKMMGFNPYEIRLITYAIERNLGPSKAEEIRVVGVKLDRAITKFKKPTLLSHRTDKLRSRLKRVSIIKKMTSTSLGFKLTMKLGLTTEEVTRELPDKSPTIDQNLCHWCAICSNACPAGAIKEIDKKAEIIPESCLQCGCCVEICPRNAISWKNG